MLLTVVGAAAAAEPLKIGFVATFSGPGGVIGTELYDGFMLGVDHANGNWEGWTQRCYRSMTSSNPTWANRRWSG